MNAHELARILLAGPDVAVALGVHGHVYVQSTLEVGTLHHYAGDFVLVSDKLAGCDNPPNWHTEATR